MGRNSTIRAQCHQACRRQDQMEGSDMEETVTNTFCSSMFEGASDEFRLVAACCIWPLDNGRELVLELLEKPIDWPRLLRLAERHRVTGMVAASLRGEARVPPAVAQQLKIDAAMIQRKNLTHVALALRIGRALEEDGIAFLVLKGAPLSQLAFGTTSLRHMRDIDILIEKQKVTQAEQVLRAQGFEPLDTHFLEGASHADKWQRYRKHHEFLHRQSGMLLELHWRAFDNGRLGEIAMAPVQWVEVGPGQRLPTLPTEELLILLCVHGASHAWFRLKWVADIAPLFSQLPDDRWSELMLRARERDLDRPLEQARLLCAGLFATDRRLILGGSTKMGCWLAGLARDALLVETVEGKSAKADYVPRGLTVSRFVLRRNWAYRREEFRLNAASPVDWETFPMPESLQFLYPLLRVPLWFRRRWLKEPTK